MLSVEDLPQFGDIKAHAYNFQFAGDRIEKHVHDENSIHVSIVCKGKVRAFSHDWSVEASAGQILDFNANQPHEIEALVDDTKIINVLKKHNGNFDEPAIGQETAPEELIVRYES